MRRATRSLRIPTAWRGRGPRVVALLALTLGSVLASFAQAAPRLDLRGWPLASRESDAVFATALRQPGDSTALAGVLADAVQRLQAAGWHEATVAAHWTSPAERLVVEVWSGPRFRWGGLTFDVPREDSLLVLRDLAWPKGEPAEPAALARTVEGVLTRAVASGHAWAQLAVTDWRADSSRIAVRLSGALGPRVMIDSVRIEGLRTTRPDVAARALGRLAGVPYNPEAARASVARLAQLGVFSRVGEATLAPGPRWDRATLVIPVTEPRYNRFEGALGVQAGNGVVGLAALDLGNLLGTARMASLAWQSRGAGRTDFSVRYVEPFVAGLPYRAEVALAQQLQDSTYTRSHVSLRLSHALGTGDRIEAGYEEERVVQTRGAAVNAALQNTVFAWERDGRDDALGPRHGTRLRVSGSGVFKRETLRAPAAGEATVLRSRAGLAECVLESHHALSPRTGLALELSARGRFAGPVVLEPWERTPVGGARTLRGHDEEEFRADRVLLSRLELRAFPGSVGEHVALFWDHAEMGTREATTQGGTRSVHRRADGLGLGLRLVAAGGRVDVDYGVAPGRGALDGRIHLRLVSTF